eukprot:TRINITY_DN4767_c0_g1_i1.p1 TRINITY_DN4767_c0_g1~~TRINITY_DN4767_c0_g1_i1.p1  ORF type:complete len:290 (-),score=41.11 TRINITY_DN4767_c0_g1_i1:114-983(-)
MLSDTSTSKSQKRRQPGLLSGKSDTSSPGSERTTESLRLPSLSPSAASDGGCSPAPPKTPRKRGPRPVSHLRVLVPSAQSSHQDENRLPNLPSIKSSKASSLAWEESSSREQAGLGSPEKAKSLAQHIAHHRKAFSELVRLHAAARKIQQCWRDRHLTEGAKLRLIYSDARGRLLTRKSFQERVDMRKDLSKFKAPASPTLWQIAQCPSLLREAVQDTSSAARVVASADFAVRHTQSIVQRRKRVAQRLQKQLPKLLAVTAFGSLLDDLRESESYWVCLVDSLKTPKGN